MTSTSTSSPGESPASSSAASSTNTAAATSTNTAADWWRSAVVYQVYPRAFTDSTGSGVGDLAGIRSRIPYLASLGVDAVWMSPFYPSALADGGYDVDDYRAVDPRLGTLDDFDGIVTDAHAAGLKVIVDIVPNHSSDRHEWFTAALAAGVGSAERARYVFRRGRGANAELPPTEWTSLFGGSAWQAVGDGDWYLHLFAPEQPDFDWSNREVRDEFLRTLRFWSDRGVDGFRIDVAHGLAKDLSEPLPVGPPLPRKHDGSDPLWDRDDVHEIFEEWRTVLNEYDPPRSAVAEAWVPAERRVLYARPTELGQAFNFDLLESPWTAEAFREIIGRNLDEAAQSGASSTWVLSNHDVVRHASRYGLPNGTLLDPWLIAAGATPGENRTLGLRRARAATLLMLALPGSAYLYQGEELGLPEVADLPAEVLQDPIWQRTGGIRKGRDGARIPLPWTSTGPSYGFGPAASELPQPAWFAALSVEAQEADPHSTLALYRSALALRRSMDAAATMRFVNCAHTEVLHLVRSDGWESVTNFSLDWVPLPVGTLALSSRPVGEGILPPNTTAWLRSV
ncbi:MAG: alpha-amylase [Glaciihabitans sp.]|nr:alpha-amylase [Glaciihabitans sp.]